MSNPNIFGGDPLEDVDFDIKGRGDDVPSLEDSLLLEDNPPSPPVDEPAEPVPPVEEPEPGPDPEPAPEPDPVDPKPADPEDDPDKQYIPRARFNELNDQRKAAEQRARELEARLNQSVPPTNYDFDSKEKEYMDAVLEGDHAKALALRKDIRAAEMDLARTVAANQAEQAKEATKAELEFDRTVGQIESEYPVFDRNHQSYNQELVEEVLDLHAGFVSRGYTPAAAMQKASTYVAKANGLVAKSQEKPAPSTPTPKAASTNVKSKLDTAAQQPPMQGGVSGGEVAPDYKNLSDEEWDALPAATKARIRGDLM